MKFKIGDKVKYNSGDWLFYGTVTAVVENAINTCYRLSVDSMVNNNCKFSITQYEFELKTDDEIVRDPTVISRPDVVIPNVESYPETKPGRKSETKPEIRPGKKPGRKPGQKNKLQVEQQPELEPANEPVNKPANEPANEPSQDNIKNLPFPTPKTPLPKKRIKDEAWQRNFEKYKNGEKSNAIFIWVAQNRKKYHTGKLLDDKIEQLTGINFPFELKRNPKQNPKQNLDESVKDEYNLSEAWWHHKFNQWEKGERESLQGWQRKCEKLYAKGKLSQDNIDRLKKIGILK